jgi:hypothetical protein
MNVVEKLAFWDPCSLTALDTKLLLEIFNTAKKVVKFKLFLLT